MSPEADRRTLVRRLYLTLHGLRLVWERMKLIVE